MRVALVIERFQPGGGGVERAAYELARQLVRRDVELTIVCRVATEPHAGATLRVAGVPSLWQPLRLLAFSRRAAALTRDSDVVHSFSRTRHQQIYRAGGGSHAAYMERVYPSPRLRHWSPRHAAILHVEEAVFRDEAQIIQCNARHVADEIAGRYGVARERLLTIYNGVDVERFHPRHRARRDAIRARLGLEGPTALFVGTGFERKGLSRAIDGLADSGLKADLLVVGRDDPRRYREQARRRGVSQRVHFLGERADVEDLHAAADALVLPTHYDAFANACLEAMASGLPVATTPANGAAELIEPGVSGWICPEDFSPVFTALADSQSTRAMGALARQRAETLTWEEHARQVIELYERVSA